MPITTPFGNNTERRSITGKDLTISSSTENTKLKINYSGDDSYVWNLPTSGGTIGQVLKINSVSNNIRNLTWGSGGGGGSGGGASTIGELNDVTTNNLSDNDFLVYDSNTTVFQNRSLQSSDIPNGAITSDKLAGDVITGLTDYGTDPIDLEDDFLFNDGTGNKKVSFENIRSSVYSGVTGDASISTTGALTLAANSVESSMLNDNVITGLTEKTDVFADTDNLLLHDGAANKKIRFDNLKNNVYSGVSGNASISNTGVLTLSDNSVNTSKLADNAVTSNELADNSVTNSKLADNAVTANELADGSVTNNKLSTDAVTTDKILNDNVTAAKLHATPGSVSEGEVLIVDSNRNIATLHDLTMDGNITSTGNIDIGTGTIQSGSITSSGSISVPSGQNVNIPDQPSVSTHAANKSYVDAFAEGLHILEPCLAGTTGDLNLTYAHGTVSNTIDYNSTLSITSNLSTITSGDLSKTGIRSYNSSGVPDDNLQYTHTKNNDIQNQSDGTYFMTPSGTNKTAIFKVVISTTLGVQGTVVFCIRSGFNYSAGDITLNSASQDENGVALTGFSGEITVPISSSNLVHQIDGIEITPLNSSNVPDNIIKTSSTDENAASRIFIKNQESLNENGIYYISAFTADSSITFTRTSDVNSMFVKDDSTHNVGDIRPGDYAYILQGAHGMNKNHAFVFSNEHMGLTSGSWTGADTQIHTNANAIVITAFSGAETIHVDNETIELSSSDRHLQVKDTGITESKLANDSVTTNKILNDNVTSTKLATDSVTTAKILNANVTEAKLADGSVTANKLAADAVTTTKILDANVTEEKLAVGSVTTDKIAAIAVTDVKLANNSVTEAKILNANVTESKLAVDSVSTDKIVANAVTEAKLATGSVTEGKLAANAVTTAKIADANVTTAKIADANVTTAKIADANVTTAKILNANVTTAKIADLNVTTAKIADDSVTFSKISSANTASTGQLLGYNGTELDWYNQNTVASLNDLNDVTASNTTIQFNTANITEIIPRADNVTDLGSSSVSFKDGYFDGTINGNITSTGTSTFTTVDINGGNIDGTAIGANSTSTGAFTDITASGSIAGTISTAAQPNITSLGTLSSIDIDGGAIDGTAIGANSASTGAFTTITATGDITTSAGNIEVATNYYINIPDEPTNATHAANKTYVDSVAEGLHILEPCLVASFSNFVGTYTHGGVHNSIDYDSTLAINFSTGQQSGNGADSNGSLKTGIKTHIDLTSAVSGTATGLSINTTYRNLMSSSSGNGNGARFDVIVRATVADFTVTCVVSGQGYDTNATITISNSSTSNSTTSGLTYAVQAADLCDQIDGLEIVTGAHTSTTNITYHVPTTASNRFIVYTGSGLKNMDIRVGDRVSGTGFSSTVAAVTTNGLISGTSFTAYDFTGSQENLNVITQPAGSYETVTLSTNITTVQDAIAAITSPGNYFTASEYDGRIIIESTSDDQNSYVSIDTNASGVNALALLGSRQSGDGTITLSTSHTLTAGDTLTFTHLLYSDKAHVVKYDSNENNATRVMLKNQTNLIENGIYYISAYDGSNTYTFKRTSDFNSLFEDSTTTTAIVESVVTNSTTIPLTAINPYLEVGQTIEGAGPSSITISSITLNSASITGADNDTNNSGSVDVQKSTFINGSFTRLAYVSGDPTGYESLALFPAASAGSAYLEFTFAGNASSGIFIGLSTSDTFSAASDVVFGDIEYRIQITASNVLRIYDGSSTYTHSSNVSINDILKIIYSNTTITFELNGSTLVTKTGVNSNLELQCAIAMYQHSSSQQNTQITALTNVSFRNTASSVDTHTITASTSVTLPQHHPLTFSPTNKLKLGDIRPGDYAYISDGVHDANKNHAFVITNEHISHVNGLWQNPTPITDHTDPSAIVFIAFTGAETIHVDDETIELDGTDRHLQVPALIGVTAGTASVSKALVVDANKDIGALRNITASGEVTGGSLRDGTATLSSGALSGATTITASGAVTGGSLTDTTATLSSGSLTGAVNITASGAVTGGSLTDGTATLSSGTLSTSSNGDINFDPNGSGKVKFKGNATNGSGQFVLNCENNSHGITIKGPPHSASATYTLTLPNDDGNANDLLQSDGSGNLSWVAQSSVGATSLDGLNDVKFGGTNFSNSLLIGNTSTGTLSSADDNIGIGVDVFSALTSGDKNIGIGKEVFNAITSGYNNTSIGYRSSKSMTTGYFNTSIGYETSKSMTSGVANVALGKESLWSLTDGNNNIAIGQGTMKFSEGSSCDSNIAIGTSALSGSTSTAQSENYNVAIGPSSMTNLSSGSYNIGIGLRSLYGGTTGDKNICIGIDSGWNIGSANNNIIIGYNANCASTHNNSIIIGFGGYVAGVVPTSADSNTVVLGNDDTTNWLASDNNLVDLGSSTYKFKNGYFHGSLTCGSLTDGTATLSAGALSGATTLTASGAVTGGSLTDGTATISSGALSGVTTISTTGNITSGGSISVPSGQYVNIPDQPTDSTHAANKSYVDAFAEGLHILEPCLVGTTGNETTGNLTGTYSHGSVSNTIDYNSTLSIGSIPTSGDLSKTGIRSYSPISANNYYQAYSSSNSTGTLTDGTYFMTPSGTNTNKTALFKVVISSGAVSLVTCIRSGFDYGTSDFTLTFNSSSEDQNENTLTGFTGSFEVDINAASSDLVHQIDGIEITYIGATNVNDNIIKTSTTESSANRIFIKNQSNLNENGIYYITTPPPRTTFYVTVISGVFYIDGVSSSTTLNLKVNTTYKFYQSDSSNSSHPYRFSTTPNGSHGGGTEYTTGVTTNGTPGSSGAYTQIVTGSSSLTLYSYCTNDSGMGGTISITTGTATDCTFKRTSDVNSMFVKDDSTHNVGDIRPGDYAYILQGAHGMNKNHSFVFSNEHMGLTSGSWTGATTTDHTNANAIVITAFSGAETIHVDNETIELSSTDRHLQVPALIDVTAGTVSASKALVVDANKDIGTLRNITASGTITASTSLDVTGSAGIILENDETITNSTNGTVLINGEVAAGNGSSAGVFKSNGDYDLTLKTGNATTGSITITDGANGNILLIPDGQGGILLFGNTSVTGNMTAGGELTVGDGTSAGVFKSGGNYDLILKTGNATTGTITITDGANGNIAIEPDGSGTVDFSKANITGGAINGTTIGATTTSTGAFTDITATGTISTGGSNGLQISTDSNGESVISERGSGDLVIEGDHLRLRTYHSGGTPETYLLGTRDGDVKLFYNGGSDSTGYKFATTTNGAQINGKLDIGDLTNKLTFSQASGASGAYEFVFPNTIGSANQVLQISSVSGTTATLSWAAQSGGATSLNGLSDVSIVGTTNIFIGNIPGSITGGGCTDNTALGITSLSNITTGDRNTAVGHESLEDITEGIGNTAIGYGALHAAGTASDGSYNTAIGNLSGNAINGSTGKMNTLLGNYSGINITTGDSNICIGNYAQPSAGTNVNEIVIGSSGSSSTSLSGHGSNTVMIGNSDTTKWDPADDNGVDLGSTSYRFKDGYFGSDVTTGKTKITGTNGQHFFDTGTTFTETTHGTDITSTTTITLSGNPSQSLQVGMGVSGTGVPSNSFITSITTANTVFVINNTITSISAGTTLTFSYAVDTTNDRVLVWDSTDDYIKFAQLSNVCFLKGTKITLSDRSYKNIEDLTLADVVLTYKINGLDNIRKKEEIIKWEKDKLIGEFSESGIRNIWINPTQTYLTINNKLNVTPGHVMFFRRENKYYFSHAVNLRINDELMKSDGNYEIINTIKLIEEEINVYNFEVDNDSTYFAEDYLVHHLCELCSGYSKIL